MTDGKHSFGPLPSWSRSRIPLCPFRLQIALCDIEFRTTAPLAAGAELAIKWTRGPKTCKTDKVKADAKSNGTHFIWAKNRALVLIATLYKKNNKFQKK